MQTDAMRRAKRGDRLLQKKYPNYWESISLEKLDLANCKRCVLGQMFRKFENGLDILGLEDGGEEYGFDAGRLMEKIPIGRGLYRWEEVKVDYDELTNAWVKVIAKHKGV